MISNIHIPTLESRIREELLRIRTRVGLTQKEVAKRMGVDNATVCRMETNARRPLTLAHVVAYAAACHYRFEIDLDNPYFFSTVFLKTTNHIKGAKNGLARRRTKRTKKRNRLRGSDGRFVPHSSATPQESEVV